MKFPKNRASCFFVKRYLVGQADYSVCGVFATAEGAQDFADACAQEFLDKGHDPEYFTFEVSPSTFYAT